MYTGTDIMRALGRIEGELVLSSLIGVENHCTRKGTWGSNPHSSVVLWNLGVRRCSPCVRW